MAAYCKPINEVIYKLYEHNVLLLKKLHVFRIGGVLMFSHSQSQIITFTAHTVTRQMTGFNKNLINIQPRPEHLLYVAPRQPSQPLPAPL